MHGCQRQRASCSGTVNTIPAAGGQAAQPGSHRSQQLCASASSTRAQGRGLPRGQWQQDRDHRTRGRQNKKEVNASHRPAVATHKPHKQDTHSTSVPPQGCATHKIHNIHSTNNTCFTNAIQIYCIARSHSLASLPFIGEYQTHCKLLPFTANSQQPLCLTAIEGCTEYHHQTPNHLQHDTTGRVLPCMKYSHCR